MCIVPFKVGIVHRPRCALCETTNDGLKLLYFYNIQMFTVSQSILPFVRLQINVGTNLNQI